MVDFSKWVPCGECDHCGAPIYMRPAISNSSITLKGAEPMEYMHEDMTEECVVHSVSRARPYSDWGKFDEYMAIMSKYSQK